MPEALIEFSWGGPETKASMVPSEREGISGGVLWVMEQ